MMIINYLCNQAYKVILNTHGIMSCYPNQSHIYYYLSLNIYNFVTLQRTQPKILLSKYLYLINNNIQSDWLVFKAMMVFSLLTLSTFKHLIISWLHDFIQIHLGNRKPTLKIFDICF